MELYLYFNKQKIELEQFLSFAKRGENPFGVDEEIICFLKDWLNNSETINLQTSGTTGIPKIIQREKQALRNSAKATINYFEIKQNQNLLICLSAKYIAGKMMWVRALEAQTNIVLLSYKSDAISEFDIKLYPKIDFAAMIPLQVYQGLEVENADDKFKKISKIIVGGGDFNSDYLNKILQLETQFYHTYGMTETLSHIAIKKLDKDFSNNYFEVLEGIKISTDEHNSLKIFAPKIYHEELITNDIVKIIDEKRFLWLGRFDNIINSGGVKLIPEQIEKKLHEIIKENFFIAALPHQLLGQQLVLYIESEKNTAEIISNYSEKIKDKLDKFEIPKRIITLKKFIYTETGKIKKLETQNHV
jgi:o-succinylbenzoate---CoA ligase